MKNRSARKVVVFLALFHVVIVHGSIITGAENYTKKMFADAFRREDGFVLITVRNRWTQSDRRLCMLSAFVSGAIIIEKNLTYDESGMQRANDFALRHWNTTFVFSKRKAYNNIKPWYGANELLEVRRKLAKIPTHELATTLRLQERNINETYGLPNNDTYSFAIAHVLLERGIPVAMGDWGGMLGPL